MANEPFSMQFEVMGDTENPADAATLGDIAYGVVTELRKEQYLVEPVYNGEKGAQELFELWKAIEPGVTFVWQHYKEIGEFVITTINVVAAIKTVQAKQKTLPSIKITVEGRKNGKPKIIEGDDPETIAKIAKELEAEDPGAVTSGQAKLTARVQQQPKRRRR